MDIFIGECDGREFAYALSHDEAVKTVEGSWAFGNPTESEMAICDVWASSQSERGWKIRKTRMEVTHIPVVINAAPGTTGHVIWTCWECGRSFSDDWDEDHQLPVLLMCGCNKRLKILIGDVQKT